MRRRKRFGNRYLYENEPDRAAAPPAAADAIGRAQGAIDALKAKQQEFGKAVDKQMKSTLEFMKQAIGGMLGFVSVNAVESVVEKTMIGNWGKLATKSIATGSVYFGARMLTQDDTVRKAILVGSLINVGLSVLSDALSGSVNLGPGLHGRNVIAYNPMEARQDASGPGYSGYDYAAGYDAQW